jgi:hypothetical protein
VSYLSAAKYGGIFTAGLFAMWLYHSAVISDIRADAAQGLQVQAEKRQMVAAKAQKEVAKVEQYFYEKMQAGIADIDAREPKRVYINAQCPKLPGTNLSGVDVGKRAELDAASGRLVSELRKRVLRLETKLAAWQEMKSPR